MVRIGRDDGQTGESVSLAAWWSVRTVVDVATGLKWGNMVCYWGKQEAKMVASEVLLSLPWTASVAGKIANEQKTEKRKE